MSWEQKLSNSNEKSLFCRQETVQISVVYVENLGLVARRVTNGLIEATMAK